MTSPLYCLHFEQSKTKPFRINLTFNKRHCVEETCASAFKKYFSPIFGVPRNAAGTWRTQVCDMWQASQYTFVFPHAKIIITQRCHCGLLSSVWPYQRSVTAWGWWRRRRGFHLKQSWPFLRLSFRFERLSSFFLLMFPPHTNARTFTVNRRLIRTKWKTFAGVDGKNRKIAVVATWKHLRFRSRFE